MLRRRYGGDGDEHNGCARHSPDYSKARGAPERHSHHDKYRSLHPPSTDAGSREHGHLERLVAAMQDAFNRMLQSVQQYRLVSTRREKLWVLFHRFSLEDGIEICKSCDVALNLSAPESYVLSVNVRERVSQSSYCV